MQHLVIEWSGKLAPVASIACFLAPIPTILGIKSTRSVGNLPLLPYSSMVASTFLWTTYGILRDAPEITFANLVGLALGLYYVGSFVQHVPPNSQQSLPGTVQQHIQGCAVIIGASLILALSKLSFAADLIGSGGVVFCLAMFAAPLTVLKTVLRTKSAASIPLPFTIATVANCSLWTVWGIFGRNDPNIYLTNGPGLMFGLAQLALKIHFGNGKPVVRSDSDSDQEPLMSEKEQVEMALS